MRMTQLLLCAVFIGLVANAYLTYSANANVTELKDVVQRIQLSTTAAVTYAMSPSTASESKSNCAATVAAVAEGIPVKTEKQPPQPPPSPQFEQAMATAQSVVASGQLLRQDRERLMVEMADLSAEEHRKIKLVLAEAINNGQLKPRPDALF